MGGALSKSCLFTAFQPGIIKGSEITLILEIISKVHFLNLEWEFCQGTAEHIDVSPL